MNKLIQNIKEEEVLFFDLEVVRANKELEIDSIEYSLYQKKTRNRDTDEYLTDDELQEDYRKRAALKMGFNRIVTIGVGFIKEGQPYVKALKGTEEQIISEFCSIANQFKYVSGANILGFDLPIVQNNGWKYFNMTEKLNDCFIVSGKRPWNLDKVLDVMEIFKGTHGYNSSVEEMCYHFGIPSPKTDIDGSMVSEVYYDGGIDRIVEYVKQDVLADINIFRRMRNDSIFTEFIDRTDKEVEKKPILQRLYNSKELTTEIVEELRGIVNKKKPNKKEREILTDILEKLSIQEQQFICGDVEIIQADKQDVKELKKRIISELWN